MAQCVHPVSVCRQKQRLCKVGMVFIPRRQTLHNDVSEGQGKKTFILGSTTQLHSIRSLQWASAHSYNDGGRSQVSNKVHGPRLAVHGLQNKSRPMNLQLESPLSSFFFTLWKKTLYGNRVFDVVVTAYLSQHGGGMELRHSPKCCIVFLFCFS